MQGMENIELEKDIENAKTQMRKGMLEFCVLLILNSNRAYPSEILEILRRQKMIVVEGTLYTHLNRLRKERKLDYEWEESPKGPPRKYYFITPYGKGMLSKMEEVWDEIESSIHNIRSCFPSSAEASITGSNSITVKKNLTENHEKGI